MEKSDESRTRRDEQRRKYSKMDKRAKTWLGHLERMEEDRMPKRYSLMNWKRREDGEDPGKDGKRK